MDQLSRSILETARSGCNLQSADSFVAKEEAYLAAVFAEFHHQGEGELTLCSCAGCLHGEGCNKLGKTSCSCGDCFRSVQTLQQITTPASKCKNVGKCFVYVIICNLFKVHVAFSVYHAINCVTSSSNVQSQQKCCLRQSMHNISLFVNMRLKTTYLSACMPAPWLPSENLPIYNHDFILHTETLKHALLCSACLVQYSADIDIVSNGVHSWYEVFMSAPSKWWLCVLQSYTSVVAYVTLKHSKTILKPFVGVCGEQTNEHLRLMWLSRPTHMLFLVYPICLWDGTSKCFSSTHKENFK